MIGARALRRKRSTGYSAEGLAFASVFHRCIKAGADRARRAGGDREAPVVEAAHCDLETVALIADPVLLGHLDVGHEDRAHVTRPDAEAILDWFGSQRWPTFGAVEHEGGDAAASGLWVCLGENEQEVGGVRVRNPHLFSVEHVTGAKVWV